MFPSRGSGVLALTTSLSRLFSIVNHVILFISQTIKHSELTFAADPKSEKIRRLVFV